MYVKLDMQSVLSLLKMTNNSFYKNNNDSDSIIHDLICFLAKKIQANTELDFEKVYESFGKLLQQKNIDIFGFPSLILKISDWRRQFPEKLFRRELSRIDRGGNLGISFSKALCKFNELDSICFDNIKQDSKDEFIRIINKRLNKESIIKSSRSSVWIPLVDESNYVWFGKCSYDSESFLPYFMNKDGDCPQIEGESYKLGEEIAKELSFYTKSRTKIIVTGVCDDSTGIVSAVNQEKFELKIESSLDFGADYIIVPKENYDKSNICKKSINIIPLSNLDELNALIHQLAMKSIDLDRINELLQDDKIYEPIKIYNEANKRSCETMINSNVDSLNSDFTSREKAIRINYFIKQKYSEAYEAYCKLIEDFSDYLNNNPKDYLRVLLNKIKCEDYFFKNDKKEYKEELEKDLDIYKNTISFTEDIGSPLPTIEFFEITVLFYLNLAYNEGFKTSYNKINSFYEIILYKIKNNINDLQNKWLNSISDSRFYFTENGRSNLLLEHCNYLYNSYAENLSINNKVKLLDLMAETEYFSGTLNTDSNAYNNIISKLNEAIKLKPNDVFAEQLRKRVKEMKISDLQIRRFRHDSNSKLGDLKNRIKIIEENNNLPHELQNEFANIKFGIDSLAGIHYVSMEKKPSRSDWVNNDISNYIDYYFKGKNLFYSIKQVGNSTCFDYCEKYLSVVLDNLIKNADEAYEKKNTPKDERKYEITVNYDEFIVVIRDFAGGIASEIKDKLFEEHASTKEEVMCDCGLGLYQAKKAMNLQEGCDIRLLEPQPENGAAFVLDFKGE